MQITKEINSWLYFLIQLSQESEVENHLPYLRYKFSTKMYFALWIDRSIILTGEIYKTKPDSHWLADIIQHVCFFSSSSCTSHPLHYETHNIFSSSKPCGKQIYWEGENHKNQVFLISPTVTALLNTYTTNLLFTLKFHRCLQKHSTEHLKVTRGTKKQQSAEDLPGNRNYCSLNCCQLQGCYWVRSTGLTSEKL